MSKIEITKTELVWPGKYNDDGTRKEVPRVNLPFQIIETINESRATREAKKAPQNLSLFDVYKGDEGDTFEQGWKNKLVWGDNLLVMGSLLEKFAGKIDLIYIDPPFATGADFSFATEIGDGDLEVEKEQSVIEEKAYRDTWGRGVDSYLDMMCERIRLLRDLLTDTGSLYLHVDWHAGHYLKCVLDEVLGYGQFRNQIIWWYYDKFPTGGNVLDRQHDFLLQYAKSDRHTINKVMEPRVEPGRPTEVRKKVEGKITRIRDPLTGKTTFIEGTTEKKISDVWRIPLINSMSGERLRFGTQKPEALLERVVAATSNEGDLIADFFCGSGTALAAADKLGRRWIGCDLSRWAIHVTRKRLLELEGCKPFEVLNLGKYERKYWQGVTFGERQNEDQQWAIFQYIAFILKLYRAEPLAGMQHLHGKKGKAVVHVGAVDAPVTIDEINACIEECLAVKQSELHVLGWEWEMGLANLMVEEAKRRGVKLLLLIIPREVMEQQAVDKGDIRFFEVAHLEVEVKHDKGRKVAVGLKDFAFPYADLIPEEVRSKIKKWSDYIDYWAVDWNFQNDTFMNGWVAYRTRKERKLPLASDGYVYEKPGKYRIMVKVVDIFGNDTSQIFEAEVR